MPLKVNVPSVTPELQTLLDQLGRTANNQGYELLVVLIDKHEKFNTIYSYFRRPFMVAGFLTKFINEKVLVMVK